LAAPQTKTIFIAFCSEKVYTRENILSSYMSLTRQIAHNTLIQIAGKIITTLLGLIAIAMMTRYLGAERFGWYITAISFLQFAGILIDFGLIPVSAQMLSEGTHERTKLFQNLMGFRALTAFVCLLIVPLVSLFFPYPHEVKIAITFTTVSFFAIALNQILTGFLQTELKMYAASFAELFGRIFLIVGLFFLIQGHAGFLPIMLVVTLSSVIYTLGMLFFSSKYISLGMRFDWSIWKDIIVKMWPVTLSIVFNVIYLKGDILLLSLYRSQEEVGLYGAAYRVIDIVTQIAMLSMGLLLPLLSASWARKNKAEFEGHYTRAIIMMMIIGLPMATGMYVLARPIMQFVGGTEFVNGARALQTLAIAVVGLYIGAIYGHTAVALNKQKQTIVVYISAAVLTLTGYLVFVPQYGMIGAAWMSVFSEVFVGIFLFLIIHRQLKVSFPFLQIGKIILSCSVMGVAIFFLQNIPIALSITAGTAVYGTMLLLTKTISKETLHEITKRS
jgi:O-antigen/teichoic acid export membrane protein